MSLDDSDEETTIKKNIQELKRIYTNNSNNTRLCNEILDSVEKLKNDLKNDVKNDVKKDSVEVRSVYVERIKNSFKKLNSKIDDIQEKVLKEVESLPPEQQESVVTFWEISSEFLTKLFDWISIKFKKLVKLIKQGLSYMVNKIEQFFSTAVSWIKNAFNY